MAFRVLIFAAALRKGSYNRRLAARAAAALAREGAEVDHADFREFEMPLYDGDVEDATGIPPGGRKLIERIAAADAVVIASPEYNGGIPGTLKNAIDWVSRADVNPLTGKPLLLIGTSPGAFGAIRGLAHARVPLDAVGAHVYPRVFGVPQAAKVFNEQGELTDPAVDKRLGETVSAFLKYARALVAREK